MVNDIFSFKYVSNGGQSFFKRRVVCSIAVSFRLVATLHLNRSLAS